MQFLAQLLLFGAALFLILLVLVQRGRGGGLAGALGGVGGSSAFGAKAGDVFTKITIVTASIWIVLCIVAAKLGPSSESRLGAAATAPPGVTAAPAAEETDAAAGADQAEASEEAVEGPALGQAETDAAAEPAAEETEVPAGAQE